MGRRTILSAENMTLITAVDVLAAFQTAAAGSAAQIVKVTRMEITQNGTATPATIRGQVATRNTSGTLTTTSTTPQNEVAGGAASGLTGSVAVAGGTGRSSTNASVDSGGSYTQIFAFNFTNVNGYFWKPDYDEQILVPPSTLFVARFLADPGTLTGWTVSLFLDELSAEMTAIPFLAATSHNGDVALTFFCDDTTLAVTATVRCRGTRTATITVTRVSDGVVLLGVNATAATEGTTSSREEGFTPN